MVHYFVTGNKIDLSLISLRSIPVTKSNQWITAIGAAKGTGTPNNGTVEDVAVWLCAGH